MTTNDLRALVEKWRADADRLDQADEARRDDLEYGIARGLMDAADELQAALDAQAGMVLVPEWFLRQVFGMAREGCSSPTAAYRWCERIDAMFFTPDNAHEYAAYEQALPAPFPAGPVEGGE